MVRVLEAARVRRQPFTKGGRGLLLPDRLDDCGIVAKVVLQGWVVQVVVVQVIARPSGRSVACVQALPEGVHYTDLERDDAEREWE